MKSVSVILLHVGSRPSSVQPSASARTSSPSWRFKQLSPTFPAICGSLRFVPLFLLRAKSFVVFFGVRPSDGSGCRPQNEREAATGSVEGGRTHGRGVVSSSESTGRDPLEGQIVAESDSFLIHSQSRSPGSQGTLASVAALVLVYLDVHSSCARAASPFEFVSPHASLARSRPHPLGPPRGGENSEWRRGESRLSVCLSPFLARVSPQISLKCIHLAPFWRATERTR